MKTLHKNLLIAASLFLLAGAGCTQPATTSLDTDNANETVVNTTVTNTNEAVVENTNAVLENTNTAISNTNDSGAETIDTSDWLTYTNDEYGFSLRYPNVLHVTDKTSIQSGGSYKLFLTLSESYDPNGEDFGVDVRQIDLIGRYDSVIKAINNDSNQAIVSDVSDSNISKTITTRNKTNNQTKIQTLTESNGNVILFTCAEWSDKEICSQIISSLQLL